MFEKFERFVKRFVGFAISVVLIGGCATYEPSPIDWSKENAVWLEKGELRFDSLDDVGRVALVGNRELHQLRLKRASSEKVAAATGWWEDPELDFDLMRVVNPTENPIVGGASLSFTIPLSGVKGLERKAAEAYTKADAADIVAAELETAVAARSSAVRLLAAREAAKTLKDFADDPRIADALSAAEKLSEAGELSKTEAASARLRRHQRVHRLREAEAAETEAELALRRSLGVAPDVKLKFVRFEGFEKFEKFENCERAFSNPSNRSNLAYIRHPKVQAALCRLDGSEAALEAEIHRQYPDLKVGPAYSREEGFDRFGIVAGLTLPLWNRNRKGIAEAEGVRDEAKLSAIAVWRDIVLDADAAYRTRTRLMDHPPESLPNKDEARVLFDAGELNALEYLAVCEEALDAELTEIDWRRDLQLAQENMRFYSIENKTDK